MPVYKYRCISCNKNFNKEFFNEPPSDREDKTKSCEFCTSKNELKQMKQYIKLMRNENHKNLDKIQELTIEVVELKNNNNQNNLKEKIDSILKKQIKKAEKILANQLKATKNNKVDSKENGEIPNRELNRESATNPHKKQDPPKKQDQTETRQDHAVTSQYQTESKQAETQTSNQENLSTTNNDINTEGDKNDGFTLARNCRQGSKQKLGSKQVHIQEDTNEIVTKNSFQLLQEEDYMNQEEDSTNQEEDCMNQEEDCINQEEDCINKTKQCILIGDYAIREQKYNFGIKKQMNRNIICKVQARIENINLEISKIENAKSLIVITGNNNIHSDMTEKILGELTKVIKESKTKAQDVYISSLLPRIGINNHEYSKMRYINRAVNNTCRMEGVKYIDIFSHFDNKKNLYEIDGINLNSQGQYILAFILEKEMNYYLNCRDSGHLPKT